MVERHRQEDKQENISASGLSPFKSAIFRTLWIAALLSYVGAAMYDVGASWLMTPLTPNPLFVSLVTTATTLPIFLFALPSGYYPIFLIGAVYSLSRVHICLQYLLC